MTLATVLSTGLAFPECPRWREGALFVSDMHTGEVSRIDITTGRRSIVMTVPGSAAGLAWDDQGNPIAVSMTQRAVYRRRAGVTEVFADLRPLSSSRSNELESDRRGGFFVGNVGFSLTKEAPKPTRLGHLSGVGELTIVADDLICPNGMAMSSDGSELVVAESYRNRVTAFTVSDDGTLVDRRTLIDLSDDEHPDGLDRDAEGGVWVAIMGSHAVRRFDVRGVETDRVTASQPVYACRIGGASGDLLFLCTSSGIDVAALERRPGRVEVVEIPRRSIAPPSPSA